MKKIILSDYRMIKFCIKKFKIYYDRALYSKNKEHIELCIKYAKGLKPNGEMISKRCSVIVSFIIKNFYRERYQIILSER